MQENVKEKTGKGKAVMAHLYNEDIFVVLGSSKFFNDIFGIMDHGFDFLWLRWRTELPDLHLCLVLEGEQEKETHSGLTFIYITSSIKKETRFNSVFTLDLVVHSVHWHKKK